ncbi:hypothetical protein FB446DRAFT_477002 [Lentinula raphanica]|uniref:Gfd2/YDR514C-like C-terminal domain-containing protein n=1 Tax=Lentinula raphanica TaxID=153919 RepID=A0AA38UJA8_9AGAR|nr:hypothetical protein C8R42DRAFT_691224 [Lentinula raphanica]KAJ3774443.1 hypothetical protein FB446DRAFT_477002 [Lentinula raphanica]KAJ3843390.1 hypothetical protein F5878DRAFT_605045 [Lentinula raphanica]
MGFPVVTGYYRYTDIWFEWHKQCGEDGEVLKAVLAHDALVSPEHPLHVDGVDGAQLYIGTLKSGETRLFFSSKQVDYIRYWLHALGLTKDLIGLPYSDCLLRLQDLRGVSPQNFKTGGELRNALKKIEKNNKSIKKSNDPPLTFRRTSFETVRKLWQNKIGVWCSLDFEAWERDHTMITECGWSRIHWEDDREIRDEGHLIVKEYQSYTNGTYVTENRKNYSWGSSEIVSKKEFKSRIQQLLNDLRRNDHTFLVFHDAKEDIDYMESAMIEADLSGLSYTLPNEPSPAHGVFVVDTVDLFGGLQGEGTRNRGLEQVCNQLQIKTKFLHNAGNDAHYTLEACKEMASGDSVDMQREKRWPSKTTPGTITVNIDALEAEEDASDEEGIFMSALTSKVNE